MDPSFVRGVWWLVILCTGVFGFTSFFGAALMSDASGKTKPIVIRDALEPGMHHLSGMIEVGFTCENVSVESHKVGRAYELEFNTWRDAADCSPGPVPRDFALTLPGPSDAAFVATLDGRPVDIALRRHTTVSLPHSTQN